MKSPTSFIATTLPARRAETDLHSFSSVAFFAPFVVSSSDMVIPGGGVHPGVMGASGDTAVQQPFLVANDQIIFDAAIDYPSVVAFVLVTLAFGLHKLLVNRVTEATSHRMEASKLLERIQSSVNGTATREAILLEEEATRRYRSALQEEERLRTLIPGVRIAGPNDQQPKKSTPNAGSSSGSGTTAAAKRGFLAVAVLSQIVLLLLLALYPMVTDEIWARMMGNS